MSKEINISRPKKYGYFKTQEFFTSRQRSLNELQSYNVDSRLIVVMNVIRILLGDSVNVNSCGRSPYYNNQVVGGAKRSQHLTYDYDTGLPRLVTAVDLSTDNYEDLRELVLKRAGLLFLLGVRGVGLYDDSNFVHIDVRHEDNFILWGDFTSSERREIKERNLINIL